MARRPKKNERRVRGPLLRAAAQVGFAEAYYGLFERQRACRIGPEPEEAWAVHGERLLVELGVQAKYHRGERFWAVREKRGVLDARLHLIPRRALEVVSSFEWPDGLYAGDPWHLLALAQLRLEDPYAIYNPPFPRLPFDDERSLRAALALAVDLQGKLVRGLAEAPELSDYESVEADQEPAAPEDLVHPARVEATLDRIFREVGLPGRFLAEAARTRDRTRDEGVDTERAAALLREAGALTVDSTAVTVRRTLETLPATLGVFVHRGEIRLHFGLEVGGASHARWLDDGGSEAIRVGNAGELAAAIAFALEIYSEVLSRLDRPEYRQIDRPGRTRGAWPI